MSAPTLLTRTVLYCSPFVPPEWIDAHGFTPIPDDTRPAQEPGPAPAGMCGYAHRVLAQAARAGETAAIVFATSCDQLRRAAEWQERHGCSPVFLLHVPATWQRRSSFEVYLAELGRLGRFLESLGGVPPDAPRLRESMRTYEASRTAASPSPPPNGNIPLMLLGGPAGPDLAGIEALLGKSGAHVAVDATEFGQRTLPRRFCQDRMETSPLEELAAAYFDSIPDAFRRPDNMLHIWLRDQIRTLGIRGVIVRYHVWCDTWAVQLPVLRETLDVPLISFEVEDGHGLDSHTAARLTAFVEMLRGPHPHEMPAR